MEMPTGGPKIEMPTPFPMPAASPDQGMAKYVTAALLEAAKNQCQCTVCQLLRKVAESMTKDLLEG